ncbi:hypothetical protein ES703_53663 [subsurface metagenome]
MSTNCGIRFKRFERGFMRLVMVKYAYQDNPVRDVVENSACRRG